MKTTDNAKGDPTLPEGRLGTPRYDRLLRNILVEVERSSLAERRIYRRWRWRIAGVVALVAALGALVWWIRP